MQRRELLKSALLAFPATLRSQRRETFAYVGCYTTEQRHGRGDGIHVYRVDRSTGAWSHVQQLGELVNPSFLITSRQGSFLYSVHGDERYATSFSIDRATGRLAALNKAETGGVNGVHQALSRDGRFLVVANYGSGTVAVLPVHEDGSLGNQIHLVPLEGTPGPNRIEQTSSHPHQIVFDPSGRFVLVPDKGFDRVFVFRFDEKTGKLTPTEQGFLSATAGSGPRHLAFHPKLPVVWVLNELNSTTVTCAWDAARGTLKPIQTLSSLPPGFTGNSTAAEIAVAADGRFVYCSNRGHDSIAVYRVNSQSGTLTSVGWTPSQGKTPRFIGLDPSGRFLYSAHEQGDTVGAFRVNAATGALTAAGEPVRNLSPVTIAFAQF